VPGLLLLLMSPRIARREVISLGIFALLMIPKSYWFFRGHPLSMFVNPVLLVTLAWQVLADRQAWRRAWRILRFRAMWYVAGLPVAWVCGTGFHRGCPASFLSREHWSLRLD
jgi:3-hydroxymyristoyl/3-hydroxydecanoyl-(acyl carrier protein) dehydratase